MRRRSLVRSEPKNQYCQALDCSTADLGLPGDTRQMFAGQGREELVQAAGEPAGSFHLQRLWGPTNEKPGVFQESRRKAGMEKCLYTCLILLCSSK